MPNKRPSCCSMQVHTSSWHQMQISSVFTLINIYIYANRITVLHCPKVFCKKDVLPKLFMIFITLKTSDKKCLKIEKAWFLLVHWVVKNNRLILLCHFLQYSKENGNLKNMQFVWSNSCLLANRETVSLFFSSIFFSWLCPA